jgi:hypothetical protein
MTAANKVGGGHKANLNSQTNFAGQRADRRHC